MADRNLCMSCCACCAAFRVSSYWAEGDDAVAGGVPVNLTIKVNPLRRAMRYTGISHPRYIALNGRPGRRVHCRIYERRPSVCRNFEPSWNGGARNPLCDKARAAFGLEPLLPYP
jgi:uncharacterized protein